MLVARGQGRRSHRIIGGHKSRLGVWGLGDFVPQKLKLFCETTHNICIKVLQTTVAVTLVDILNDTTSKILGGTLPLMSSLHKYWGTCPPVP